MINAQAICNLPTRDCYSISPVLVNEMKHMAIFFLSSCFEMKTCLSYEKRTVLSVQDFKKKGVMTIQSPPLRSGS